MIETDSLTLVFLVEALIGLSLVTLLYALITLRRRNKERRAANELVNKLTDPGHNRSTRFKELISESCTLADGRLQSLLSDINKEEKNLYQQIIRLFISRDIRLLEEIEQRVNAVTEPFCQFLSDEASQFEHDQQLASRLEAASVEIAELKATNEKLSEQLAMALETMDEVSSEYIKMFGDNRDSAELIASKERMIATYQRAEQKIHPQQTQEV